MLKFNDYLKEAALSAKQKKIAAVAGDKDKIDSADLTALRAGKKPVEEACSDKDMKKEELVGNQHKLDKNKNGKLDAHDFKLLRKEAKDGWSQNDSLAKPVTSSQAMADHSKYFNKVTKLDPKTGEPIKKDVKEEVEELDEGRVKELAYDLDNMSHDEFHKQYGKPKHYYDPKNFKKPVEPGKGMDRARALAQRGMQSLSKEEVERLEEKLTQIDELSKGTLSSYVKRSANQAIIKSLANPKDDSDDMKTIAKREKGINLATSKLSKEEVERIEEKLAQLGEGTYKHEVEKSFPASGVKTGDSAPKGTTYMPKDKEKAKGKPAGSIGEEVEQEMSPYLKGTLKVMDEGKIDNLRDAQKLRQDNQSAYSKGYKPDTSHPHIQVVKGSAYGGENQKDDEGDEKPDDEKQEKKGRGRPAGKVGKYKARGSKSAGDGIDDREYQLHLPNNK
jgi:hypothetical protein